MRRIRTVSSFRVLLMASRSLRLAGSVAVGSYSTDGAPIWLRICPLQLGARAAAGAEREIRPLRGPGGHSRGHESGYAEQLAVARLDPRRKLRRDAPDL